ncbi:MAG: hypothetical protein JZU65_07200 [Chlorobium sp.]|nr:hypothetical protein [Chlorobium sp.]
MNQSRMKKGQRREFTGKVIEMHGFLEKHNEPIFRINLQCGTESVRIIFAPELGELALHSFNSGRQLHTYAEVESRPSPCQWQKPCLQHVARYVEFYESVFDSTGQPNSQEINP